MSEEDNALMSQYGITRESKLIYSYGQHRYENLKDAVNYARLVTEAEIAEKNDTAARPEK